MERYNKQGLDFFLKVVELETKRTKFYNGNKKLLPECMRLEHEMREYINEKLATMRFMGAERFDMEKIPEDVPARKTKKTPY